MRAPPLPPPPQALNPREAFSSWRLCLCGINWSSDVRGFFFSSPSFLIKISRFCLGAAALLGVRGLTPAPLTGRR